MGRWLIKQNRQVQFLDFRLNGVSKVDIYDNPNLGAVDCGVGLDAQAAIFEIIALPINDKAVKSNTMPSSIETAHISRNTLNMALGSASPNASKSKSSVGRNGVLIQVVNSIAPLRTKRSRHSVWLRR